MNRPLVGLFLLICTPLAPASAQVAAPTVQAPSLPSDPVSGMRNADVVTAQVLLDRSRHSPGVIDGQIGGNTECAIRAYQRAKDLEVTGRITPDLLSQLLEDHPGEILRYHVLTEGDVSGPFVTVPTGFEAQAELDTLGYERPSEKIAEQFHMAESFLLTLNPGADFGSAGTEILVVAPGDDRIRQRVARIEVDKEGSEVRAFTDDGTLLATYPATVGSSSFPTPDGSMTVNTVAPAATYHFSPEGRSWGPDRALTIAAGPNNPVGGIWIDLSEAGYGIDGSPDPQLIGKTASHGCVRLTNWDARELAQAVFAGTAVEFK